MEIFRKIGDAGLLDYGDGQLKYRNAQFYKGNLIFYRICPVARFGLPEDSQHNELNFSPPAPQWAKW